MIRFASLLLIAPLLTAACSPAEAPSETSEAPTPAPQWNTLDGQPPLVIAHRGASGLRPEHSQAAYQLALDLGADVVLQLRLGEPPGQRGKREREQCAPICKQKHRHQPTHDVG